MSADPAARLPEQFASPSAKHPAAGLALGVLAVALFGATLPVTRLTLGHGVGGSAGLGSEALSPIFITAARVALAAAVSAVFLLAVRSRWPQRGEWWPLLVAAAGNAVLYPLSLAVALQDQSAAHVAVVTALLPLATAGAAALALRWSVRRARAAGRVTGPNSVTISGPSVAPAAAPLAAALSGSPRFWLCAVLSTVVVAGFSLQRSAQAGHTFGLVASDLLVAGGVLAAAVGYVQGAKVTRTLGAERVICWVTLLTLPVSLPLALWTAPAAPLTPQAGWGLAYLALVSMWAAFFAWYRALDWGGPLRVSQVQVFQPFFSVLFAWPLLGEVPDELTLAFAATVVALVAAGLWRPSAHR